MSRSLPLICLAFCVGLLVACTKAAPVSPPLVPGAPPVVDPLTAAEDPDGDGENKGYGYFPMHRTATGNKVFIFDPNYDAWAVYDADGNRVNVGVASGGSLYCPDLHMPCKTIVGTFKILSKDGADCISHTFPLKTHGGAPMPYCMWFDGRGYAIHGSYEVPDNANASHGCIRVKPTAAKWLNEDFLTVGSTVIVLPYN